MATLNRATRELNCKIVFYGPACGGKTTNLQQIHAKLPKESKGDLTSLATREDRTLFFDLLPVDMGRVGDYHLKVQLYTVPGQVRYDATRRVVLRGVDGVVMVFDSDPEREEANYMSLANLEENLGAYGLRIEDVPTVFQYNKRDLPGAMPVEYMRASLNPEQGFPEIEASAVHAEGVMETIKKICSMVFERIEGQMPNKSRSSSNIRMPGKQPSQRRSQPKPERQPERPTAGRIETATGQVTSSRLGVVAKSAPSPRLRLRQMCDLRIGGINLGYAVMDLAEEGGGTEKPDFRVRLKMRPLFGAPHEKVAEFWRAQDTDGGGSGIEVYKSPSAKGSPACRLRMIRGEGKPARAFLDWKHWLGSVQIAPEGRVRAVAEERGAPENG